MSVNGYDGTNLIPYAEKSLVDATPTAGSTRPVSSGGVYDRTTGTLRYLGVKKISRQYDGDTTIADMMFLLYEDLISYVNTLSSQRFFSIASINANPSQYYDVFTSSEMLHTTRDITQLYASSVGGGSLIYSLQLLKTSSRNESIFTRYDLSASVYNDLSGQKPADGKEANIRIEEYELLD